EIVHPENLWEKLGPGTPAHDALNRIDSETTAGGLLTPNTPTTTLTHTHDPVGNTLTTTETLNGVPGAITATTYDNQNRVVSIVQTPAASGGVNQREKLRPGTPTPLLLPFLASWRLGVNPSNHRRSF
ncbi:MAG: hypothetical protein V3V20_02880, partial [Algisphaera sp.]